MKNLSLSVFMLLFCALSANVLYAQSVIPVTLNLVQEEPDKKGTDITNIYTVEIQADQPADVEGRTFEIVYFLDDIVIQRFDQQTLPFSFKRNYKGKKPGAHKIRVELLDENGNKVAQKSVTVNVVY